MSSPLVLFSRPDDNILTGASTSGSTAPSTGYALADLLLNDPGARVLWGVKNVTLVFTLGSALRGDVLAIPVWNVDAGSSVAALTNGAGLSQAITVPTMPPHRIPDMTIVDLRVGTPSNTTRTSTTWTITITSNTANVVIGGCVWIGQLRTLDRNLSWGAKLEPEFQQTILKNRAGTQYPIDYETVLEGYQGAFDIASDSDRAALKAAWQATHGGSIPMIFWADPTSSEQAFLGRLPAKLGMTLDFLNLNIIPFTFVGISKGEPV